MKIFGILQYNGGAYWGFEKQKDYPSIQGKIEETLSSLLNHKIVIHGAGRTDKGVSARGQTFTFFSAKDIQDIERLRIALNRLLPKDICVLSLKEVDPSFDARHSSCGKIYSYSFHFGERNVLSSFEYQLELPGFSFPSFEECMNLYRGIHDFKNFTSKPMDVNHFIRDIRRIEISEKKGHVCVLLEANGFMTHQIRIMIAIAFRVGLGKMSLEEVQGLLSDEKRRIISYQADPVGLILEEVLYGK
ncbi:MAG TPA: tRNA pseudouridine(38-40) synthase TruA [Firmicutes bacterium]|nr:tRNA pseudouridine(38-40) synthase TruA [Bacillota bacterium]